nr:winged helix-turn-helix domain-containing protein [Bradyrhizobium japonicum]
MRYLFDEYVLDTDRRELHRGADAVSVAPQVFDILDYLIGNRERVVSKDDLMNAIWKGRIVSEAALATRMNGVRARASVSSEPFGKYGSRILQPSLTCQRREQRPSRYRISPRLPYSLSSASAPIPNRSISQMASWRKSRWPWLIFAGCS